MRTTETFLLRFLDSTKQFILPIFHRQYSWGRHQCEQLWDDALCVGENEDISSHFLGSIVFREEVSTRVQKLLVIDGQQRLTTLSLLLSALGRAIEARNVDIGIDRSRLEEYYLFNDREAGELRYKQLLTQHDRGTLFQLLDEGVASDDTSPLVENYRFFEEQLEHADLETVYKGVQKLMIVDIALDSGSDNPQLIFESLNSTGLNLSQADLIRNLRHHRHLTGEMLELFQQLRRRIQRLDASVQEQIHQTYIAYRTNRIFVSIIPQARRLLLILNLRFPDIDDPQETCRDMTNIGHLGVGDVEVGISSAEQFDDIMFLIRQAFDRQMEDRS